MFKKILLCNLPNKPHIQVLIVICEIHEFHRHFLTWCSYPSLTGDLSLVGYGVYIDHLLLGRTFVFGLHTKKTLKTLKTTKKTF